MTSANRISSLEAGFAEKVFAGRSWSSERAPCGEARVSCSSALSAIAGVLKTMLAEVSSIHSIRVGRSDGKCSAVKALIWSVVRSSSPRICNL